MIGLTVLVGFLVASCLFTHILATMPILRSVLIEHLITRRSVVQIRPLHPTHGRPFGLPFFLCPGYESGERGSLVNESEKTVTHVSNGLFFMNYILLFCTVSFASNPSKRLYRKIRIL